MPARRGIDPRSRREAREQQRLARERFLRSRRAVQKFERQLAHVGRHVGQLIRGFAPKGEVEDRQGLDSALRKYADLLHPWATATVAQMQAEVGQRDTSSWEELARSMGFSLRKQVESAPIGGMLRELMGEQVHLITSIPLDAAERVQKYTVEALLDSSRAEYVKDQILKSTRVSVSKARLLARDQVGKTGSLLTQVRAVHVGSPGYYWRTSKDAQVRPKHKKLEGKLITWDNPPVVDEKGRRAHAGQDIQCRCYMEVLLPKEI